METAPDFKYSAIYSKLNGGLADAQRFVGGAWEKCEVDVATTWKQLTFDTPPSKSPEHGKMDWVAGLGPLNIMAKLNDLAAGRDNNFNLLRMIAASAVLVSHAYPIAIGEGVIEPLSSLLQMSLGTLAVLTFFAISGFFISQSFDRRHGLIDFWVARILRIYPILD